MKLIIVLYCINLICNLSINERKGKYTMDVDTIMSLIIGAVAFELYNKFYAKGDKKKLLIGIIAGVVCYLLYLIL